MTKEEIKAVVAVAKSDRDLSNVDDCTLFGYGLADFVPVYVTTEMVAKLMRWQCAQLNGEWDAKAFDELCHFARTKFILMG